MRNCSCMCIWCDPLQFATYQAVVATDGIRTYLMYVYPSGENNVYLRKKNHFRHIYMGYNAQDKTNYFSLYLSTTTEIVGLHTKPSNTGNECIQSTGYFVS